MRLVYVSVTVCMIFGVLLSVDLFTASPDPRAQAASTVARIVEQTANLEQQTPDTLATNTGASTGSSTAAPLAAQTLTAAVATGTAAPKEQNTPEPRIDRLAALPAGPSPESTPAKPRVATPVSPISTAQEFTKALNAARARQNAQNDTAARDVPQQLVTRAAPALNTSTTEFTGFAAGLDPATFEALMSTTPQFSPVEGLHEDLWKEKSCKSCHRWTVSDLCVQAGKYAELEGAASPRTKHPNGRDYASALAEWHSQGCE